jgi:ribosomal protein L25 (general stress protein Ctc)
MTEAITLTQSTLTAMFFRIVKKTALITLTVDGAEIETSVFLEL